MIVKSGSANALTYTLGQTESFAIEAISADIDTVNQVGFASNYCDAIYNDQAGFLIARARSSATIPSQALVTMTFAPWLPDTQELGNAFVGFVNTTGLCATVLPPGATVTVQVSEPGTLVTQVRLWVEPVADSAREYDESLSAFGPWYLVPGQGVAA